jgi:hypothetical protein
MELKPELYCGDKRAALKAMLQRYAKVEQLL